MAAILVLAVGAIGAAVFFHGRTSEPTMPEVVRSARTAMTVGAGQAASSKVDGIAFPDWSRQGWSLTGGRSDTLGHDRVATTALYQRGNRTVTLTIVAGAGQVEDSKRATSTRVTIRRGAHTVTFKDFGYGANVLSDSALFIFKRAVQGRTVVMTGAPISNALYAQMEKLLVTDLDAWNGATA